MKNIFKELKCHIILSNFLKIVVRILKEMIGISFSYTVAF